MRSALFVLILLGIAVLRVQARKQCRANEATSTTNAMTQLKSILAVVPATTTTVKPTVKATPVVKTTPKPVVKTTKKPVVTTKKPVAKVTPKPTPKPGPACPKAYPPWHLTKVFNNRYRCVGLKNIPTHWGHPYDLINVCRSKDKRAKPMSFHTGAQLEWCKKNIVACNGALTGMYVIPGKPIGPGNLRNHDGEKVDIPYTIGNPGATAFQIIAPKLVAVNYKGYTGHGKANVVCAFWL